MNATQAAATPSRLKLIVYAGLIAAVYAVLTVALGPISFGPLQVRVAGLLKPLALVSPIMGLGLAVGVGLANLTSPFGAWDFAVMPFVSLLAALVTWWLRRWPWLAMVVQAAIIAIGVAIFPLGFGAGFPLWPNVALVFTSECALYLIGYALLRRTPLFDPI